MNLNLLNLNKLRLTKKPFFEKIPFYLTLVVSDLDDFIRNGCQMKTAYVHPYFPSKKTSLYKILKKNNISIVNRRHKSNLININFIDKTFYNEQLPCTFQINNSAFDISKHHIDLIHQDIFGYSTLIDPKTFSGKGVKKSDLNAQHDGVIIQFPITEIENEKIYQIIIDNQENNLFVDYRVCVIADEIPVVYKKYKSEQKRFTNEVLKAELVSTDCLPIALQKNIIQLCQKVGCNFCELDVLKDNETGLWFVIDVNKTPYGPPAVLAKKDKEKSVEILADCFYRKFIKNI